MQVLIGLHAALGEAGVAFLGSQGDIWDAQKDMFMDVSGAVFSAASYLAVGLFKK